MKTGGGKGKIFLIVFIFLIGLRLTASDFKRPELVHNTLDEINAATGKLELKLIRVWGGEDEEDEHKFFKTAGDIAIDKNGTTFICDTDNHFIKVFDPDGNYLRTIGQRGQGPGDLLQPTTMEFSPSGDLWVYEMVGRRLQLFSLNGKSKHIVKNKKPLNFVGITSRNELVVSSHFDILASKKLISILNTKGKVLRKIGKYHDSSTSYLASEHLSFFLDNEDNIYAVNSRVPVIRKYSPEGKMLRVISTESYFQYPYRIRINERGDEIIRTDIEKKQLNVKVKGKGRKSGVIQMTGETYPSVMGGCGTDSRNRIYASILKRLPTEEEKKASMTIWNSKTGMDYSIKRNFSVLEKMDIFRLLVFNSQGKIIAAVDLPPPGGGLRVHKDRLFLFDPYNQLIKEYKMHFTE